LSVAATHLERSVSSGGPTPPPNLHPSSSTGSSSAAPRSPRGVQLSHQLGNANGSRLAVPQATCAASLATKARAATALDANASQMASSATNSSLAGANAGKNGGSSISPFWQATPPGGVPRSLSHRVASPSPSFIADVDVLPIGARRPVPSSGACSPMPTGSRMARSPVPLSGVRSPMNPVVRASSHGGVPPAPTLLQSPSSGAAALARSPSYGLAAHLELPGSPHEAVASLNVGVLPSGTRVPVHQRPSRPKTLFWTPPLEAAAVCETARIKKALSHSGPV